MIRLAPPFGNIFPTANVIADAMFSAHLFGPKALVGHQRDSGTRRCKNQISSDRPPRLRRIGSRPAPVVVKCHGPDSAQSATLGPSGLHPNG